MRYQRHHVLCILVAGFVLALGSSALAGDATDQGWPQTSRFFWPPPQFVGKLGEYRSPLVFEDGTPVKTPADWARRRREIRDRWFGIIGNWPPVIERPAIEELATERRENFTQRKVRLEIAPHQTSVCFLLIPDGRGPFPAVVVPFYDPETSVGLKNKPLLAFAYDLTRRGFVTLSIGSPGGNAWKPDTGGRTLQPLSFLGYVGANCYQALASLPQVDPTCIGIVGHSYGGKWAMLASCLYDKYAAAVWSDPGIVWDEARPNANYWEPWYLGLDPHFTRKPGVITADNPRTGAYKTLVETGHDLHELHALMAPRPFLVSGGSEDTVARWVALNHSVAVNRLLGYENRVAMTNRRDHTPTPQSNEVIYLFFEHFLK